VVVMAGPELLAGLEGGLDVLPLDPETISCKARLDLL